MTSISKLRSSIIAIACCVTAVGSVSASSFSTTLTSVAATDSINISALGTLDWSVYNTWTATPGAPFTLGTLSGPEMNGGSGIGTLQSSLLQNPGVMAGSPPAYTWTNGVSPTSGSYEGMIARYNWALSGSAAAGTTARTLYLFIGVSESQNASISISLPGSSSVNVPIAWTGSSNIPSYSLLEIDYVGDNPGDNLTFSLTGLRVGIGAAALTAVPEPSAYALLLGCAGLIVGIVIRRRR
jgi:hypothetical protein